MAIHFYLPNLLKIKMIEINNYPYAKLQHQKGCCCQNSLVYATLPQLTTPPPTPTCNQCYPNKYSTAVSRRVEREGENPDS